MCHRSLVSALALLSMLWMAACSSGPADDHDYWSSSDTDGDGGGWPDTGLDESDGGSAEASATTDAQWPSQGDSGGSKDAPSDVIPCIGPAFLHADLWSVWWNDRTRCGAERAFLHQCNNMPGKDCSLYEQAWAACDPWHVVYGQVGPEKQGENLCSRGKFPEVGGCDATRFDFDLLRFWWYGAEWQGNWPVATLKVFPEGADWKGGGELLAFSNVPGATQAAMAGIDNHGFGFGCAMLGQTSGEDKYRRPFGGFAWIEVPTGQPVTVVAASGTNFADQPFQGCQRGGATQDPWINGAPGSVLGCVYVQEGVTFEPGHHYLWQYGTVTQLSAAAPPKELVDGFAMTGVDVQTRDACAL